MAAWIQGIALCECYILVIKTLENGIGVQESRIMNQVV